jgi:hypothetical protein
MPRKMKSSGVGTGDRKTSLRRALSVTEGPKRSRRPSSSEVADGGKWAGSGRKTVERGRGPEIARQRQTGRGPKSRTAHRGEKAKHPSHG